MFGIATHKDLAEQERRTEGDFRELFAKLKAAEERIKTLEGKVSRDPAMTPIQLAPGMVVTVDDLVAKVVDRLGVMIASKAGEIVSQLIPRVLPIGLILLLLSKNWRNCFRKEFWQQST